MRAGGESTVLGLIADLDGDDTTATLAWMDETDR